VLVVERKRRCTTTLGQCRTRDVRPSTGQQVDAASVDERHSFYPTRAAMYVLKQVVNRSERECYLYPIHISYVNFISVPVVVQFGSSALLSFPF